MRTCVLCSLCTLLVCLGCGTMSHSRVARPSFVAPPLNPAPFPVPQSPAQKVVPTPLPQTNPSPVGPTLNGPTTRKPGFPGAARVSRYRGNDLSKASNPPPDVGYIELAPPQEKNAQGAR